MFVLRAESLAATHAVAAAVAKLARTGDIIVLAGEMGAGKTAFAQGFGRALGITEPITSPTFTLVHSYPFGHRQTLHHADLYRLESTGDVDDLALDELAEFGGIVLVEWGDVVAAGFGDHLQVRLQFDDADAGADDEADDADGGDDPAATDANDDDAAFTGDAPRLIEVSASGSTWTSRWERLIAALTPYRAQPC